MMCAYSKSFVYETDLFSPNEWTIMFSKEDLERGTALGKIADNSSVAKGTELQVDSQSVFLHNNFGCYNEILY